MKLGKSEQTASTNRVSHRFQKSMKDRESFRKHLVDLIL